jgi:hypothetical protein
METVESVSTSLDGVEIIMAPEESVALRDIQEDSPGNGSGWVPIE